MLQAIKAFFHAIVSMLSIVTGVISIGNKAVADAGREYDSWSKRRKSTKSQLQDFYANFDTIEELADKLQEVTQLDIPDNIKATLVAELNEQLAQFITAEPTPAPAPAQTTENS